MDKTDTTVRMKLLAIARYELGVETLDVRGRDGLDFHSVSVNQIEDALMAAYELGRRANKAEDE